MGRPQEEAPSPYTPESNPQPPNSAQFMPEGDCPYDSTPPSYPPGNDPDPQPQFQPPPPLPQPQALNPSSYPPTNTSYPLQPGPNPSPYPPQNQPSCAAYPPSQPAAYPPNNPNPGLQAPTGYGPQPVSYPPPSPSTAVPQQYPPPPVSPHNPLQHDVTAQGIPVQAPPYQPAPQPYRPNPGTMGWSTGIFDCMDDPMNALVTAFFPCITFGQIAEIVDSGHTTCSTSGIIYGAMAFLIGLPCLLSCTYRTKLRSKYDLVEAPAPDWVTHFFCEWCALCQEYRELKAKGLEPELGWHGNMGKHQQPEVAMAPPTHQTMMG